MPPAVHIVTGTVCLQGGNEFSAGYRPIDAALVRDEPGRVVVTALAGAPGREYDTANANGVAHYRAVGASDVVAAPDVREDPRRALEVLRSARLLVLPGGSPARLLTALRTYGVDEVLGELLAGGGTVMGSSAGAMVLGSWTVLPERPGPTVEPGLGLVPGVLVVPHWSGARGDWMRAVETVVPVDTLVLGIAEDSGVVARDGVLTAVGSAATRLVREAEDLGVGEGRALVGAR